MTENQISENLGCVHIFVANQKTRFFSHRHFDSIAVSHPEQLPLPRFSAQPSCKPPHPHRSQPTGTNS